MQTFQTHIMKFVGLMKDKLLIKSSGPMRAGTKYSYLKLLRSRYHNGTLLVASEKHVDSCIRLIGMEDCKPAPTPLTDMLDIDESPELDDARTSALTSCIGILIFVSKHICCARSKPQPPLWPIRPISSH